jgi:hypothetical protein
MGGGRTGVRSNGRPTDSVATRMPSYFLPMKRLASYSSVPGMVAAVGRARSPTKASTALVPLLEGTKTTDGVIDCPAELGITTISPSSKTATHEKVVPRSIPTQVTGGAGSICCTAAASSTRTAMRAEWCG